MINVGANKVRLRSPPLQSIPCRSAIVRSPVVCPIPHTPTHAPHVAPRQALHCSLLGDAQTLCCNVVHRGTMSRSLCSASMRRALGLAVMPCGTQLS